LSAILLFSSLALSPEKTEQKRSKYFRVIDLQFIDESNRNLSLILKHSLILYIC